MLPIYSILANSLFFMIFIGYLSNKYGKFPIVYFLIGSFVCGFPLLYLRYEFSGYLLTHHLELYLATRHYHDWVLWILISVNYIIYYQLLRKIWKKEKLNKELINIDEIGKPSDFNSVIK